MLCRYFQSKIESIGHNFVCLLVSKGRAEVEDEGGQRSNSENREEVSSEVGYAGCNNLAGSSNFLDGEHVNGGNRLGGGLSTGLEGNRVAGSDESAGGGNDESEEGEEKGASHLDCYFIDSIVV
mmetsp:Transcript_28076/g.41357  ORF Transcript_28076/g.41357 Transcript_28076/m.41357 type:complete len:124 (-) Transcript_28076:59-430(-)